MSTTTTSTQTQGATPRLAIKKEHLVGLDPEWVELWHTHGAHMVRADELELEEYRKNPAQYSFTYPTCTGKSIRLYMQNRLFMNSRSRRLPCRGHASACHSTGRRNDRQNIFARRFWSIPSPSKFPWRYALACFDRLCAMSLLRLRWMGARWTEE